MHQQFGKNIFHSTRKDIPVADHLGKPPALTRKPFSQLSVPDQLFDSSGKICWIIPDQKVSVVFGFYPLRSQGRCDDRQPPGEGIKDFHSHPASDSQRNYKGRTIGEVLLGIIHIAQNFDMRVRGEMAD